MVELDFHVTGAEPDRFAAAPTLLLHLAVSEASGAAVGGLALRCQLRIEPQRRDYTAAEGERLAYLFGGRNRWGETLRPMQLATVATVLPAFHGHVTAALPVPWSYDVEVAAGKYLHALGTGEVPLLALFSGMVFVPGPHGVQVAPVPWHCEAEYQLPVRTWRELMDHYFPGSGWLRLRRETIDALLRYQAGNAIPSSDEALARLVSQAEGASG